MGLVHERTKRFICIRGKLGVRGRAIASSSWLSCICDVEGKGRLPHRENNTWIQVQGNPFYAVLSPPEVGNDLAYGWCYGTWERQLPGK